MIFCGDDLLLVEKTSFFPQVIITERAEHALTVLQSDPLHHYDGVVSVGGDGMLAEVPKNTSDNHSDDGVKVFNGLILRAAEEKNIDVNAKDAVFAKPAVRVGFIPCGECGKLILISCSL